MYYYAYLYPFVKYLARISLGKLLINPVVGYKELLERFKLELSTADVLPQKSGRLVQGDDFPEIDFDRILRYEDKFSTQRPEYQTFQSCHNILLNMPRHTRLTK